MNFQIFCFTGKTKNSQALYFYLYAQLHYVTNNKLAVTSVCKQCLILLKKVRKDKKALLLKQSHTSQVASIITAGDKMVENHNGCLGEHKCSDL